MIDLFHERKIVAAVRSEDDIKNCLNSKCKIVFLLFGTLMTAPEYIKELKEHGKSVFVHVDLIEGLSSSNSSIDYIDETTNADGIISIKQNLLKYAKRLGFITILRTFLLDSKSLEILQKINMDSDIDILEILPGIVLTAVPEEVKKIQKVIIGGGLIHTPQMVDQILAAGASAVSTSDPHLWELL